VDKNFMCKKVKLVKFIEKQVPLYSP